MTQDRAHHRHHRPGRRLPGRAPARRGLHRPRHQAPRQLVQHRARRPPLPGPAPARRPLLHALRRPHRRHQPHPHRAGDAARRDLQPGRPEPRAGQLRDARVHGQLRRPRHAAPARGHAHPRPGRDGALLPGLHQRDVRPGAGGPAARDHAVLPAQPVRRRQGVRLLDHRELPRGLRDARQQRHPLQPREPHPRRDLRDAQDHARRGAHRPGPRATASGSATSTRCATGATPATTCAPCT